MNGFLLINKPAGVLSFSVVSRVRSIVQRQLTVSNLKVGHGGTLDSFADGLLVVGIGSACKHLTSILKGPKRYAVVGQLGIETDTLDPAGNIISSQPFDHIDEEKVVQTLATFLGDILQTPPLYSAIKIDGERASDRIRRGEVVALQARPVSTYSLQLTRFQLPIFGLDIHCSSGFYVRSLVRDVARAMCTCAHATALTRTQSGPFLLDDPRVVQWDDLSLETILKGLVSTEETRSRDERT